MLVGCLQQRGPPYRLVHSEGGKGSLSKRDECWREGEGFYLLMVDAAAAGWSSRPSRCSGCSHFSRSSPACAPARRSGPCKMQHRAGWGENGGGLGLGHTKLVGQGRLQVSPAVPSSPLLIPTLPLHPPAGLPEQASDQADVPGHHLRGVLGWGWEGKGLANSRQA